MEQKAEGRYINHLLYASPVKRGSSIEIIEDIVPIYNVNVTVNIPKSVNKVYLDPQLQDIPYIAKDGKVSYTIPILECHQMIVIE